MLHERRSEEPKGEETEPELRETRSEPQGHGPEKKLSEPRPIEQTRAYAENCLNAAADLVRRHPIPIALATVVITGGIMRRAEQKFSSRRAYRAAEQLLNRLSRRAEQGSEQVQSAVSRASGDGVAQHLFNELLPRVKHGLERAKSAVEHSSPFAATDGGTALRRMEELARRAVDGITDNAPRAVQSMSQREVSLPGAIAMAIGVAIGTALVSRR